MDYLELLEKAKKEMPVTSETHDRFEVPKVLGHIQGNRTIISNFVTIAQVLRRDPEHLLKYILKELATPGEIKKSGVIFGRKVPANLINQKIQEYVKDFVLCKECKKPDTKLLKEGRITLLKCMACGASHPIKARI